MPVTSLIVANLTTTSLYAASFVVQVYSDSGLTTLVGSDSCAAVKGSSVGFVQATALVVHGLTYGTTYYARAGVVAPVTGIVTWSAVDTIVMGTHTVPSGSAYTATLTPTINGINVSCVVTSLPSDLAYFEAYWSTVAGVPATSQVASWKGNQDGAGHLVFFAGTTPSTTLYIYARAVNTTGQKQTWTSLGSATSLAASPSSSANLVYATPDGTSGAANLRALVAADIPSLPESKITNLVTDLAAKVPTSTTVNGHALSANVVVSASDLTTGTLPHAQLPTLLAADIPVMVALVPAMRREPRLIQVQPLERQSFFARMRRGRCLLGLEAPSQL